MLSGAPWKGSGDANPAACAAAWPPAPRCPASPDPACARASARESGRPRTGKECERACGGGADARGGVAQYRRQNVHVCAGACVRVHARTSAAAHVNCAGRCVLSCVNLSSDFSLPLLTSRTPSFPPSFPPSYLLPPPSLHPSPFPPSPPPTQDRHQDLMHEGAGKGNEHANVRIGLLLLLLLPAAPPSTCRQLQRFLRVHVCACVCMRE